MAVLLTIKLNGIQEYIFQSNLLKENIGASHITNKVVFREVVPELLLSIFDRALVDTGIWYPNPAYTMGSGKEFICKIGDVGGGGVILIFNQRQDAEKFIREFSLDIICKIPGLKYSAHIEDKYVSDHFKDMHKASLEALEGLNKSGFLPTAPVKLGLMKNCKYSAYGAEFKFYKSANSAFEISSATKAKLDMADGAESDYSQYIDSARFSFAKEIELLGQKDENNYMAVVHIDGNGIGSKVSGLNTLEDLQKFSIEREKIVTRSLKKLIDHNIVGHLEWLADSGIELKTDSNNKIILPIRPLLHGGDDITFICNGRLGLYLAEAFIRYYTEDKSVIPEACAGVAIVKTKFPFYKAYQLSEQLCGEAKKASRKDQNRSYLSFYYSSGGVAGDIEDIRAQSQKLNNQRSLYFGPYSLHDGTEKSIGLLKKRIAHFQNEKNISKTKVMQLRDIFSEDDSIIEKFVKAMTELEHVLPDNKNVVWENNQTRLYDPISLFDFYPETFNQ
jgi:hypothetical protein